MEKKEKVLIIKTGYSEILHNSQNSVSVSYGDILRTTLLLHLFKDAEVTWVTDEKAIPLLENNPYIKRLLPLNFTTSMHLLDEEFDTIINLEKNHDICKLSNSLDAWKKFGFRYDKKTDSAEAYDRAAEILAVSFDSELKKNNQKTVQELLFEIVGKKWNGEEYLLSYKPKTKEIYDVGLNTVVGKKWPTKAWLAENWGKLKEMLEKEGFKVTKQDEQGTEVLENLYNYMDWINSCKLIVTPDTLGMHLAIALRKKVLALFGPTPHKEAYFYGLGKEILSNPVLECMPCFKRECEKGTDCMKNISIDLVYEEIKKLLNKTIPLKTSESAVRRDFCRVCNSLDMQQVFQFEPTPPGDRYVDKEQLNEIQEVYPLDIFLCNNCGLLQLGDIVNPEILYREYIYTTSVSLGLSKHFEEYAEEIIKKINPQKNSLVIDIGSNDGTLLKFFKERGMKVLGIDPAKEVAEKTTKSGIETIPEFFTSRLAKEIKNTRGQAKIITANNVLANIDNLSDMINGIKELLASDGIFAFETAYMPDLIQKNIFDNIYHEHLSYFGIKPIKVFFSNHGMELIDIKPIPTKGGSIRGIVQLAGGPYKLSQIVDELIEKETKDGFYKPEFFINFADRVIAVKKKLLNLLNELKNKKKIIAGYGASVGSTTVIYHFALSDFLSFIVDDNQSRHGLFTPGFHIPVLSPKELYEKKPDYVLILSWRYAEPIIEKNHKYLEQGGNFIVVDLTDLEVRIINQSKEK